MRRHGHPPLVAFIDAINRTQPRHIISIEDPIEIVHGHKQALAARCGPGRDSVRADMTRGSVCDRCQPGRKARRHRTKLPPRILWMRSDRSPRLCISATSSGSPRGSFRLSGVTMKPSQSLPRETWSSPTVSIESRQRPVSVPSERVDDRVARCQLELDDGLRVLREEQSPRRAVEEHAAVVQRVDVQRAAQTDREERERLVAA